MDSSPPLKCGICDKTFKLIHHLQRHKRTDHKIKIYKNSTKAKKDNNSNDRLNAIETENSALIQFCEHCSKIFNTELSLNQHILKEHGGNLNLATNEDEALHISNSCHQDSIVDKSTENDAVSTISKKDIALKNSEAKIKESGLNYLSPSEIKSADLLETAPGPKNTFSCLNCGEKLQSIIELSKHIKEMHLKVKKSFKFKCQICLEHFVSSKTRSQHVAAAHKVPVPIQKCTVCGKKFKKLLTLQKHVEVFHASLFEDSD